MSTSTTERTSAQTELARAAYRLFRVRVVAARPAGRSFVRLTLGCADLASFGVGGHDQRLKLLLPQQPVDAYRLDEALADGDWYSWWLALPDGLRPVMRTYTVRAVRPELGELDVDFVLHGVDEGVAGPASTWAASARPGDEVVVVGPTGAGTGPMWGVAWAPPPEARTLLLAGDETALPAISAILEQLPAGVRVTALLEVPTTADATAPALQVRSAADVAVHWLPRDGRHRHGELLERTVREVTGPLVDTRSPDARTPDAPGEAEDPDTGVLWDVPEQPVASGPACLYAWLAGEAGVVKALRRHLVHEVGVPRTSVAFMGYWRAGRAETA